MNSPIKRRPAAQVAFAKKAAAAKADNEAKKSVPVWLRDKNTTPTAPTPAIEHPERVRKADRSQGPPEPPNLLEGYLELNEVAKQFNKHPRSVRRWTTVPGGGMPYVKVGNSIFVHVESAREWLLERTRRHNERRASNEY
jgi:hypothetical protein